MADEITNSDDLIDSRSVIERISDLESMDERDECEDEELSSLNGLEDQASTGEWRYGVTLVRDGYFEDYARQLAEDTGAIKADAGWPYDYIDWEAASDALKIDYTSVDFGGVTYWAGM